MQRRAPSGRRWPAARCRGSSGAAGRRGTSSRGRTRVLRPWSTSLPITKCSCRSGAARSGWLRMKPPASAKLVVSMPLRCGAIRGCPCSALTAPAKRQAEQVGQLSARRSTSTTSMWSCRCAPTPGRSCTTRDAVLLQLRARADARQHQQLRRLQRAGAEQHLAPRLQLLQLAADAHLHADRAPAFEQDARGVGLGHHLQVGAAQVRRQVGLGGAEALAVLVRHLVHAHAFLRGAVEVGVQREAGLLRRPARTPGRSGSGCAGPSRSAARRCRARRRRRARCARTS